MTNEELKQKIQEDKERDFRGYAEERLYQLKVLRDMGHTTEQAINIMIWFSLEDISAALGTSEDGDIALSLSSLADCVGYIPPRYNGGEGYSFLRIAGQVDTD